MKFWKNILAAALVMLGVAGAALVPGVAYAVEKKPTGGADAASSGKCPDGTPYKNSPAECGLNQIKDGKEDDLMGTVQKAINVVLSVVGVVAVVVLIVGGISFITSQGDAGKVAKARNTILYGVVGLVVALLSFAIVNFVLSGVFKKS